MPRLAATAAASCLWGTLALWPCGAAGAPSACDRVTPDAALLQVNQARALGAQCGPRGGMAPSAALVWNTQLLALAHQQASWMADHGQLIHTGRDGQTLTQRAIDAGYDYARIAENLAHGQSTVAQALAGWTASEGHCLNLYDSSVSEMALACVPGRDGRAFWALLLGRRLPRP